MISSSIERKEIRRFGTIAFLFFGILFVLGLWRQITFMKYIFLVLSLLGLAMLLFPSFLRPVYKGWLTISHSVGKIITIIFLSLAYYLVMTPAAWIKGCIGDRPIPILPDKERSSYWVPRSEPAQPKERFIKRY